MLELSQDNFSQEVLDSKEPVLVEFYMTRCPPCKMLLPILQNLESQTTGVKFAKLNVDNNTGMAVTYEVSAVPTIVLFKDGKDIRKLVGLQSEASLKTAINENFGI